MSACVTALSLFLTISGLLAAPADDEHEYAPIVETRLELQDFQYKTVDGRPFSLREYLKENRLLLINFSAGWCKNSNFNGPLVQQLHEKYKDKGLGVVAVMEYSAADEVRIHINRIGISYPVVIESDSRDDREKTTHFKYRQAVGDKRKWGTPFYIIIDGKDVEGDSAGSRLTSHVYVVTGELIETEAIKFIETRLSGNG